MKQQKSKGRIPNFKSREEEAKWWESHDIADYQDEFTTINAKFVKPSSTVMSIRFKKDIASKLRYLAQRKGIGTTTLIRMWVKERLEEIGDNKALKTPS